MKVILTVLVLPLIFILAGCSQNVALVNEPTAFAESLPKQNIINPQINSARQLIEKFPQEPDGYVQLASGYIRLARETGDFSLNNHAEKAIEKALQLDRNHLLSRKLKASLHLTFHRFPEALELGKELEKEIPDDSFVYGVLTDASVELGNYSEAVGHAQKMIDLKPSTASFARVGHLRSLHGDFKGAVEMFKKSARSADPKDKESQSWCLVQLGDEFFKYGKFSEAEKIYQEALQNFPDYYLALAAKGRVLAAQNDLENAEKVLEEAFNRFPNAETAILLGNIYEIQNNTAKAKQKYDLAEVMENRIGNNNDQKRLALLWADQNQKLDDALTISQREFETRKDIFTADAFAWSLYKKGQFVKAKEVISLALHPNSNSARIIYHAGMIEKSLGNSEKAKKLLEKALQLNPKFDLIQAEIAKKTLEELK